MGCLLDLIWLVPEVHFFRLFPGSDRHHYYFCLTGSSYIINGDEFSGYDRYYLISIVCFCTNNQNSFIVFINFIKQTIFSI
ncbi:unknown protein [Microcystis aeruginosa NIES-843]|uniref:Uncharacterized protein n=1 Tax=Microcystis aeruginosa (strain NIES-843 / IAM M-2473) TaxID=449447 RepID=B0JTD2_MICAN|nr:unknown protein [Microcystis aeruginosa NIES-843]